MKSIAFFNNKGGVGKTTLACNLVSFLNQYKKKRVLLIDADPQCNATQVILSDEECENIYVEEDSKKPTLYSYLQPLEFGEPEVKLAITPLLGTSNRFGTDIVPGHPRMSIVEDRLSDAWHDLQGRDVRGYRISNWCHQLLDQLKDKYDLVVFDVGPSLGALNRSVILACDYIVTPFGCDIFSLLGIKNISQWIKTWDMQYQRSVADGMTMHSEAFDKFLIIQDTSIKHRFLGYSVQQYVSRKFKTGLRPVKSYDEIMKLIPDTVLEAMHPFIKETLPKENLELGRIPYLYSLVPMAQAAKAPIHALTSADGVVGNQYAQVQAYQALMSTLCDKLLRNLELS
jgi:cellulose biosynthesis protein BcsQ